MPLHTQVENLLRALIKMPDYQGGALLPREVDLASRLGISRNTIRQATNKLEYEGLLVRKKGVGTRVAGNTVTTQLDQWHSFTQEMNEQGVVFKSYEISVLWWEADEKLRQFFNIPEGTWVLCLRRLRGSEEVPFVYFESYFHPSIGLTGQEDFSRPLYEILEHDFRVVPTLSRERIKARLSSAAVAKKLQVSPGEAILVRERFVYDTGERPVEYNIGHYRADRFTYSIDIRRGSGNYGEKTLTTDN